MLQNAYLVSKIGPGTAENEQHFAEILPIGRRVRDPLGRARARNPPPRAIGAGRAPRPRRAAVAAARQCGSTYMYVYPNCLLTFE